MSICGGCGGPRNPNQEGSKLINQNKWLRRAVNHWRGGGGDIQPVNTNHSNWKRHGVNAFRCWINRIFSQTKVRSGRERRRCTDKKENKILLIYKEIQSGAVAKSYMKKGFLSYEGMRKYFPRRPLVIYDFATAPFWIFLIYEENLIFFFISVGLLLSSWSTLYFLSVGCWL